MPAASSGRARLCARATSASADAARAKTLKPAASRPGRPAFMLSVNARSLEQPRDRRARLRTLGEPVLHLRLVEVDRRGVGLRVVAPDDLDEAPVPRRARVGDDDAVDRVLLRADARQPDPYSHLSPWKLSCASGTLCRLRWRRGPVRGRSQSTRS